MTGTLAIEAGRIGGTAILSFQNKGISVPRSIIRLRRGAAAGIAMILLSGAPAMATHEINHRFIVWGEVLTSDGEPVVGETITFTVSDDTPIGSVVTNDRGRYRVVLHVHDQDLGKIFDMTVRGVKTTVKIEFDPTDKVTERGQRVDFTIEK